MVDNWQVLTLHGKKTKIASETEYSSIIVLIYSFIFKEMNTLLQVKS